ncbi:uncharacterized protein LOC123967298 isoform X3 [Micropterus dolomieu]|uniref:uncharacterized protein LOC123967298 isoform X3 n=1 Tax=Micropterus dolomieu TaxID=147949 RepID=UPI001E8D25FE|nr:uncharacterized protein LOC123967298 isoform X3 [Micropterus dolomieu]
MKVTAPAMSRQAFLKMLEHRSVQAGRAGSICADTFQQSFFEFTFCQYIEEETCQVHHFECPACSPDMLAVCSDGNPKHYRFSKSKGTEEPPIYEDGTAKFTAGREISKRQHLQVGEIYLRPGNAAETLGGGAEHPGKGDVSAHQVESLRGQTLERIKTSSFGDLTEDATHGLNSVLNRRGGH